MNPLTFLISNGVTQSGAVQTVLGQPISNSADRVLVEKLRPPIAKKSLSYPRFPSVVQVTDRGWVKPGSRLEATLRQLTASDPVWFNASQIDYITALASKTRLQPGVTVSPPSATRTPVSRSPASSGSTAAQINELQRRLHDLARRIQAHIAVLAALQPPTPPGASASPAEIAAYQAQVAAYQVRVAELQNQIEALQKEMAATLAQLQQLT